MEGEGALDDQWQEGERMVWRERAMESSLYSFIERAEGVTVVDGGGEATVG